MLRRRRRRRQVGGDAIASPKVAEQLPLTGQQSTGNDAVRLQAPIDISCGASNGRRDARDSMEGPSSLGQVHHRRGYQDLTPKF